MAHPAHRQTLRDMKEAKGHGQGQTVQMAREWTMHPGADRAQRRAAVEEKEVKEEPTVQTPSKGLGSPPTAPSEAGTLQPSLSFSPPQSALCLGALDPFKAAPHGMSVAPSLPLSTENEVTRPAACQSALPGLQGEPRGGGCAGPQGGLVPTRFPQRSTLPLNLLRNAHQRMGPEAKSAGNSGLHRVKGFFWLRSSGCPEKQRWRPQCCRVSTFAAPATERFPGITSLLLCWRFGATEFALNLTLCF